MLKKMVDGKEVICSDEEERLIRMKWALNDQYPEYSGHLAFDGVSEPYHVMDDCKQKFLSYLNRAIDAHQKDVNAKIETCEENGDEQSRISLLIQRKQSKDLYNIDISNCTHVQHLRDIIPEQLKYHWPSA